MISLRHGLTMRITCNLQKKENLLVPFLEFLIKRKAFKSTAAIRRMNNKTMTVVVLVITVDDEEVEDWETNDTLQGSLSLPNCKLWPILIYQQK